MRLGVEVRRAALRPRRLVVQVRERRYRQGLEVPVTRPPARASRLRAGWRRVLPFLEDYELAFGPEIDALEPDVLHAHDVHLIGVAERAAARARTRGRAVPWIYDAHEYVPGVAHHRPRELRAYTDLEREYIRRADRVITVSEPLAAVLQRSHRLARRPDVVMNITTVAEPAEGPAPSVRRAAGLPDGVPVIVYSGGVNHSRGVHTLVEALPLLPEVHAAVVSNSSWMRHLERTAEELGCRDRLHVLPYVPNDLVAAYLSSATIGISPILHFGNYEVALPNKYFEYLHARLPILTSDVRAMAALTRELGVGEVFRAGDPQDLAAAARRILADIDRYTAPLRDPSPVLERYRWEHEEQRLLAVYADLLGPRPAAAAAEGAPPGPRRPRTAMSAEQSTRRAGPAVVIGPRNTAGQAWAWARALEREGAVASARSLAVERGSALAFPADEDVPVQSWKDLEWQLAHLRRVLGSATHVLLESGSGLFGLLNGGSFAGDLPVLRAHGIAVALVFHGSEVRSPRLHRALEPWSPFPEDLLPSRLPGEQDVERLLEQVAAFDGPRFVTTLDLADHVPGATWLPVTVATPEHPAGGVLERPVPVVVHAGTSDLLKGSAHADAVGEELAARGVIAYRRLRDVAPGDMPAALADADVVLDQFALGDYGVLACQAMAAGRVVIGHVADRVRKRLPAELPIVQATPADLREVLLDVVQERDRARAVAAQGAEYARTFHDGRHAVEQLRPFLTEEAS